MQDTRETASRTAAPFFAGVALAALTLGWLLFHPLRNAAPFLDDFVFFAIARHIDAPLALLVQDALGTYFFRPLVMFAWWVVMAAFGPEAPVQYAVNAGLHALNGLLAFLLLRRYGLAPWPAAVAAMLFLAHPTAFSASAWLAARFDLAAATFGLAGLLCVERYCAAPSRLRLAAAVACAIASMASKEIGFALVAAMALATLWPANASASSKERMTLLGTITAAGIAMLAWRDAMLRPAPEGGFLEDGLLATIAGGTAKWLSTLPQFLVVRHDHVVAEWAWIAALLVLAVGLGARAWRREWMHRHGLRCAALGLGIAALAALAQSPVSHAGAPMPFSNAALEHISVIGARLHYVPLVGFTLAFAALLDWAWPRNGSRLRFVALAMAFVALVGLLATSRLIGREWSAFTRDRSDLYVKAAVEAVRGIDAAPGCLLFFIGTPGDASLFRAVVDTAVKRALPQGHPATTCFMQSEHAPWNHLLVRREGAEPSPAPLQPMRVAGAPYPPLRVANLTQFYLRVPEGDALIDEPRSRFFAFRDGRFVEVTADVRARRLPVRFQDERNAP